jgi:chemotaxis protein methyltransferase CheR
VGVTACTGTAAGEASPGSFQAEEARVGGAARCGDREPRPADPDELPGDAEVQGFLAAIHRLSGIDFRSYAARSVRRRIRHIMLHDGVATLAELEARVLRDAPTASAFAQRVCVNVTSMFRDPPFFLALRQKVVPILRTLPFIRVWHVGCSTGEEAYSMAILLREEGLQQRSRLYATDVDESALAHAARGVYPLEVMREYTQNYQRAGGSAAFSEYYSVSPRGAVFDAALRRNIVFSRHNLATDESFHSFQVILCRNVLMYFEAALQRRALAVIWRSLAPGGLLGLGQREIVPFGPCPGEYEELDLANKLYRRPP